MANVTKIYGPPGTGKTTWCVEKVQEERAAGVQANRIAYLSYTVAAAQVVAHRIKMTPGERHWFRTIHSACVQRLGIDSHQIVGGRHYDDFMAKTGYKLTVIDGELIEYIGRYGGDDFGAVLRAHRLALSQCLPMHEVVRQLDDNPLLVASIYEPFIAAWTKFKVEQGLYDFEDMLTKYVESDLDGLPCDAVILDEAQDCSELQWRVFNKLTQGASRVYVAGDDDQAIYAFMGGSDFGFLDYPADQEVVLKHSWRVPAPIGIRATALIRRLKRRKDKEITWRDGEGSLDLWQHEIASLPWRVWREQGEHVYVLCRHVSGTRKVSEELLSIGVPHALGKFALHKTDLAKLVRDYWIVSKGGKIPWRRMANLLDEIADESAATLIRSRGKKNSALTLGSSDCNAKWNDACWVSLFATDKKKIEAVYAIVDIINQEGNEAIGTEPRVSVMTMHGAKGREADIVVIVPDCQEIVRANLESPSEIRLAYVALTRAKKQTIVLEPQTNTWITHLTEA